MTIKSENNVLPILKSSVLAKVVIPVYKPFFGELEELSFRQCCEILKNYEIVIVHPEGLDCSYLKEINKNIQTISFSPHYFKNLEGYNSLLLSAEFYEQFLDSSYILIYQLDAYVFKDELESWCSKGYDYIGSPWLRTKNIFIDSKVISAILRLFWNAKKKERQQIFFKVGNGGFSLRKVASHYKIAKERQKYIHDLLMADRKQIFAIEDVFWSLMAPKIDQTFTIPHYSEAVYFSMDRKPNLAMKLTGNLLPFGCHAINKPKVSQFWRPFLK